MVDTNTSNIANQSKDKIGANKPTGIDALDTVIYGGIPSDSIILLAGASGTGKTVLAMQWLAIGYEKYNESGLYLTLTEPVNKVKRNVEKFPFWKPEYVEIGKIYVEDLRTMIGSLGLDEKELTNEDIDPIVDTISDLIIKCKAKRVVIDSVTAIAYRLRKPDLIRKFIYHLDALLSQMNINFLMTSEVVEEDRYSVYGVEEFVSDGIIQLHRQNINEAEARKLTVVKMRGTQYNPYPTSFSITKDGFNLYPRLQGSLTYDVSKERILTGIDGLTDMTEGGYVKGSTILITGSSGTGKSLISLQFVIKNLEASKKAILVSFEESRDQIIRNAQAFGWNLEKYEKDGSLKFVIAYPEERYLEEHIDTIKREIDRSGADVMVVDSLSALANVFSEKSLRLFVSQISSYLKEKLVTTILTNASSTLMGADQISDTQLSTMTDQIIMLRYVEIESELKHALLVLKMRGSKHDKKMRELIFTPRGVEVTQGFSGFEGVLAGSTRKVSQSVGEQLHDLFMEQLGPMGSQLFEEEKKKGLSIKSVKLLLDDLGNQGIISVRRKDEFEKEMTTIWEN